jgi:Ricin-type beta-trefoil lectin domain-like
VILKNQFSGLDLGVANASAGTELQQFSPSDFNSRLQWDLWPTDSTGEVVQLVNAYTGMCTDVTGFVGEARVIQFPCKGQDEDWRNQLWYVRPSGDLYQFAPQLDFLYRLGVSSALVGARVELLYLTTNPHINWSVTTAPLQ